MRAAAVVVPNRQCDPSCDTFTLLRGGSNTLALLLNTDTPLVVLLTIVDFVTVPTTSLKRNDVETFGSPRPFNTMRFVVTDNG
jgi:hypothetical protein